MTVTARASEASVCASPMREQREGGWRSLRRSDGLSRNVRQCVSAEVGIRLVSELCQVSPETPSNRVIYGDTAMHIVVAEVVDRKCVVAFCCALQRAARVDFQACSFQKASGSEVNRTGIVGEQIM